MIDILSITWDVFSFSSETGFKYNSNYLTDFTKIKSISLW